MKYIICHRDGTYSRAEKFYHTHSENTRLREKQHGNKFRARITINGVTHSLGRFKTQKEVETKKKEFVRSLQLNRVS